MPTRRGVHLQDLGFYAVDQGQKSLDELEYLMPGVQRMLDALVWLARYVDA